MKTFRGLVVLGQLLNRLLDKLEQYDKERKQIRREDRRRAINENPAPAWRDTFGSPSGRMRVSADDPANVRHHSATTGMDGDGSPRPGDPDR